MQFNLLQNYHTTYCADSVEWCPFVDFQQYFVCGTYELHNSDQSEEIKTDQIRLGQLHLFSVTRTLILKLHETVDSAGILDIKWCPLIVQDKKILATANADGKVVLWEFKKKIDGDETISLVLEHKINETKVLSLSLDWSKSDAIPKLCVSDSAGYLHVLQLNSQFELTPLHKLKTHDYEAWVVTFDENNDSLLLSGGDDGLLKITDLKTGKKVTQLEENESGVTSIRFNHINKNVFASGSYDETIKIWDSRNTSQPLSSVGVGGGIWRIKWDPQNAEHILVAGMYSGFFWLKFSNEDATLRILNSFKQHESIAYGADISHLHSEHWTDYLGNAEALRLTATCSFYDKKLCLCSLK